MTTAFGLIGSAFLIWMIVVGFGLTRGTLADANTPDFSWRRARMPIIGYAVSMAAFTWSLEPSEPIVAVIALCGWGILAIATVAVYHSLGKSSQRRRQLRD